MLDKRKLLRMTPCSIMRCIRAPVHLFNFARPCPPSKPLPFNSKKDPSHTSKGVKLVAKGHDSVPRMEKAFHPSLDPRQLAPPSRPLSPPSVRRKLGLWVQGSYSHLRLRLLCLLLGLAQAQPMSALWEPNSLVLRCSLSPCCFWLPACSDPPPLTLRSSSDCSSVLVIVVRSRD